MKKRVAKRLLSGCLAAMMLFGDAAGALASELSGAEAAVTEAVESTEHVGEKEGADGTEVTEIVEAAENIGDTEIEEQLETIENVEIVTTEGGVISNLTYEFLDLKKDTIMSTSNENNENTVKLLIFDVSDNYYSIAEALKYADWDKLDSEKIQFLWLCSSIASEYNFQFTTHKSTFYDYMSDYQDMVNRFGICIDGENLDEEGNSKIEAAYNAYWEISGLADEPANVCGDNSVLYMINGANEIIGVYQYDESLMETFFDTIIADIPQHLTCDLTAPTDLTTYEYEFGYVRVEWSYASMDGVKGFRIYRSDDGGTTYGSKFVENWYEDTDDDGNVLYYTNVEVPLDSETGNNAVCTYKVVPVDDVGLEGAGATVKNKSGCVGDDFAGSEYTGICFVGEDGNAIEKLELHVGESKKIGLAFTKADGSLVNMATDEFLKYIYTWPDFFDELYGGYTFDINWKIIAAAGEVTERNLNTVDYETSDVDWLFTEEVVECKEAYFKAKSMPAEGTKYFVEVRVTGPWDASEIFWLRLPVSVIAAEEGVVYDQPEELPLITSEETAKQELRDFMTTRDYNGWIVTKDVSSPNYEEVMDIYAERAGMKPNEGDYLFYMRGDRNSVATWITYFRYGYITYKDTSYNAYGIEVPFITTAEEEAEVDAKINALVHTEGGALYEAAHGDMTDEEKVKAIYDWIIANVNPQVDGDRTTPMYHTVYSTLFNAYGGYPGSGTCGAFAVLFTRLSREMGIASKVIMGTDSAAHAYNIVQLGQKWYFIDTNSKRYLSDADEFERAQEQGHYLDPRFINNYLSKIPGNDYIVASEGTAIVTDDKGTEAQSYATLDEAVNYVLGQAALEGNETVEYTITIKDGNMAFAANGMSFIGSDDVPYGDRVSLDLGGNTIIVGDTYGALALLGAKYVHNGVISVGDDVTLRLYNGSQTMDYLYEDLELVYKSTTSEAANRPGLSIWGGSYDNKLVLADTVQIEEFYDVSLLGNVEVNDDIKAQYLLLENLNGLANKVVVNGIVTADDLTVQKGAMLNADTILAEKAILEAGSELYIQTQAELNGIELISSGENIANPMLCKAAEAEVALNGSFTSASASLKLDFAVLTAGALTDMKEKQKIFTTDMTQFPVELIQLKQASETPLYNILIQKSGYIYVVGENTGVGTGVGLSYVDGAGETVVENYDNLAEAVLQINNLKVKRAYTITLYDDYAITTALTLPNKAYVEKLTIEGAGIEGSAKVSSANKLALTSNTVLKNLHFESAAAYAVSIGDYDLTIDENVEFLGKVSFSSGKKGSLTVTEVGQLCNVTNLNVAALNNAGEVTADTVKLTNAYLNNGHLYSNGGIQVTNMTVAGEVVVRAEKDFKVTGTLHSETDKAVFYTRQNTKGVPYLNISGTVTLDNSDNKIQIGVYASETDVLTKLETGSMLLNVKTATADMFVPVAANVGNAVSYPAENGYFLQKSKNGIYVHYGDEASTALYKDDIIAGYFASFEEAVAEIEARKDLAAEYTIVLLKDVNSEAAPSAVNLPSKAANVIITGLGEEIIDIFYTGNLTLKSNTEFVKIRFNPMNKNGQGAASKIAARKFDLTLCDTEVGSVSGMAIKDITGSKTQITTLDSNGLVVTGNISGSKELVVERPVTVKGSVKVTKVTIGNGTSESASGKNTLQVAGAFSATELEMQGYAVLDAAGAVSVTDIYNNKTENITGTQANGIYYTKNSKDTSNLTVKGWVSGNNETVLELHYIETDANKTDYQLAMKSGKYTLNNKLALAAMQVAALSEVTFYLGETKLAEKEVVKANKAVYVVDASNNPNVVRLMSLRDEVMTTSYCLDYSQAINEINNSGDSDTAYSIQIGLLSTQNAKVDLTDTNTTDNKAVSPLTMPKKGKSALVMIMGGNGENITYSGNISCPENLSIHFAVLNPVGESSITGIKNVSTLQLISTEAVLKNITNIKQMSLVASDLITTGTATVAEVGVGGESHWDALGKTTVTDLDVSASYEGTYIASKQTAKTLVPMFTINGQVTLGEEGNPIPWKVYEPTATVDNLVEVAEYKNVSLVVAPKEDADRFVAYPFVILLDEETVAGTQIEGIKAENLISYKTIKNEVASGNKDEMVIRIIQTHEGAAGQAETYARSFDEAVTIINNLGDTTASYRMELLQGSEAEPLLTTKNGTVYGKMTLPKNAAEVTIVGAKSEGDVAISYKGSLAVNCDTVFDNVVLLEDGSVNNVSVSYNSAYALTFTNSVESQENYAVLTLDTVKIPKGKLILDNATAYAIGAVTIKDLEIVGESTLIADGKTTITNIFGGEANANSPELMLDYSFSTKNATQLTINGNISDVKLELVPNLYNQENDIYESVTIQNVADKQLVVMPKASIKDVTVQYLDTESNWKTLTGGSLYKQNGGLYFTTEAPVVEVTAENTAGREVYGSQFLNWEQAVKEIDKRADSSLTYSMIVREHIGGVTGNEVPIKTLTLPGKAKEVIITSEQGEENNIYVLGTKVSLKTNTTFENVEITGVKKDSEGNYNPISYTFAGSAKTALTLVLNAKEEKNLYNVEKISGIGAVNIYNAEKDDAIVQIENQVQSAITVTKGLSGIGALNVYPGVTLSCDNGALSAKNATICGSVVEAKDITISQTLKLEQGTLAAGSVVAKDGKLKLKDIIVEDAGNYLEAQLDSKGKSQFNITGTVTASNLYVDVEGKTPISVALLTDDGSAFAQLVEDMIVINAAKAMASWFVPYYTYYDGATDTEEQGMGYFREGFGLYNAGKVIKYGSVGM